MAKNPVQAENKRPKKRAKTLSGKQQAQEDKSQAKKSEGELEDSAVAKNKKPKGESEHPSASTESEPPAAPQKQAFGESDEPTPEEMRIYLKGLLEALLFVSDRPLTLKELARGARIDKKRR